MSQLLDANGQPIQKTDLVRELAAPSITGVRQAWQATVASGLTPARLATLLRAAEQGDASDYLTLAQEMEERDPHYSAVLSVRKHAVLGLTRTVEAAAESGPAVVQADAVRALIARPEFGGLLQDLLDALGKGYAVCETLWDTQGRRWQPKAYPQRDPRWFQYDTETGQTLRLRDAADPVNGIPLAPYKFIVHTARLRSGLPVRGGLARLVAFAWICKAYALKDWLAYAEVFGMPLRLGRYGPGASASDVAILKSAVASIGIDAAAVLPESMKIEFQKAAEGGNGGDLFQKLCEYLDKQVSKAVLGQTMTTDAQSTGLGSSQANVQNDVRADLIKADGQQLADTLNQQLVRPFIDLNFGPQAVYPVIELRLEEPEDLKLHAEVLSKIVPLGVQVSMAEVRDKFGYADPGNDQTLGAPVAAPKVPALNAAQRREMHTADQQTQVLATAAQPAVDALMAQVQQLLDESQSFEEFRDKLMNAWPEMDAAELGRIIGDALTAAQLAGRYELMIGV